MDWKTIIQNIRKRRFYHFYTTAARIATSPLTPEGFGVMDEEWDNLIVLDACRYDFFKEYNTIEGVLEKRVSRGTRTDEWVRRNFTGSYDDTVYVSANPHIGRTEVSGFCGVEHFAHVETVWDGKWDEDLGTVPPEEVNAAARRVCEQYPEKRMIIHYMQPHRPYIGETTLNMRSDDPPDLVYEFRRNGRERVRKAYTDNLELVLDHVASLISDLRGETVVTSDHGELFGEYGLWMHPQVHIPQLYEVPWLRVNYA